jgi:hypothetical protein
MNRSTAVSVRLTSNWHLPSRLWGSCDVPGVGDVFIVTCSPHADRSCSFSAWKNGAGVGRCHVWRRVVRTGRWSWQCGVTHAPLAPRSSSGAVVGRTLHESCSFSSCGVMRCRDEGDP